MHLRNGKQTKIIYKVEKSLDQEKEKIRAIKKEIYIIIEKFIKTNDKYEELLKNSGIGQTYREVASTLTLDGRDLVLKLEKVFNDPVLAKGMRHYYPIDTQECHVILLRTLYILEKLLERNVKEGPTVLYYYTILYLLGETLDTCRKLLKSFGIHILCVSNEK